MSIGAGEILIILLFALIIFGPERLPKISRSIGEGIRKIREGQDKVSGMINSEIVDPLKEPLADPIKEIKNIGSELKDTMKLPPAIDGELAPLKSKREKDDISR